MAKVIDCFTFYNELKILDLRLAELKDVVDYFILVEATKTFSGKNKRLYFDEIKDNHNHQSYFDIQDRTFYPVFLTTTKNDLLLNHLRSIRQYHH